MQASDGLLGFKIELLIRVLLQRVFECFIELDVRGLIYSHLLTLSLKVRFFGKHIQGYFVNYTSDPPVLCLKPNF